MPSKPSALTLDSLPSIHDTLSSHFSGAQSNIASHKRRIKVLCQLYADAVGCVVYKEKRGEERVVRVGEKAWDDAFWDCVLAVLALKRGVVEAERVVRFVGAFVGALMNDQGSP